MSIDPNLSNYGYASALDEHNDYHYDSLAVLDRGEATWDGYNHADVCWMLSDRDCWYKNPYFRGPEEPHPESSSCEEEFTAQWNEYYIERANWEISQAKLENQS